MTTRTFLRLLIASPLLGLLPKPKPTIAFLDVPFQPYAKWYLIRRVPRTYYQNLDIGPWRMNRSFVCPLPEVKKTA